MGEFLLPGHATQRVTPCVSMRLIKSRMDAVLLMVAIHKHTSTERSLVQTLRASARMTQYSLAVEKKDVMMDSMMRLFVSLCILDCAVNGAESLSGFRYFGELPEFTPGAGEPQSYFIPAAIDVGGRLPDLIMQAHSRLWFFINESKRGKVLFSEPIVLKTTDNQNVETDGVAVVEGNELMVRLIDGSLVYVSVVGEDVPVLAMGDRVRLMDGTPLCIPAHYFLVVDENADSIPDLQTPSGTYFGEVMNGELRFRCVKPPSENEVERYAAPRYYSAIADFDGDGTPDMVCGGEEKRHPCSLIGIKANSD